MKKIFKSFYKFLPFKKQIFMVMKVFWVPSQSVYKHLHFKGKIKVKVDPQHSFKIMHFGYQIENEIFWEGLTGGHEKISMKLWIELCKDANVVLDIGANTGIYSLVTRNLNSSSVIYAFEPVKRVLDKMKYNVELNGYDISLIEKAASNFTGTATIYDPQTEHLYSVTINKNLFSPDREVKPTIIETITLSSFIEENNIENIDLIKIDVETHEAEVLEGMGKYLELFKPSFLIEILNDEVGQNVEKFLTGLNYLYFSIDEKNGITKMDKIGKSDYYNYLICQEEVAKKLQLV